MVDKIFFAEDDIAARKQYPVEPRKPEKGFTKKNLKKLFSFDKGDILWLIFFALLFFLIWGYYQDKAIMQDFLNNPGDWCLDYWQQMAAIQNQKQASPIRGNFSAFFINDTVVNKSNGES